MKKISSFWFDIERGITRIGNSIIKDKLKLSFIVSLNRGGLVPGVLLSHYLGVKHAVVTIESYDSKNKRGAIIVDDAISTLADTDPKHIKNILIVDDIADSGRSLVAAKKRFIDFGYAASKISIATVYYKKKSIIKPDYYYSTIPNNCWIVLPWEKFDKGEIYGRQ